MSLLMDALKKAEQEKKDAAVKRSLSDSGIHFQARSADTTGPNQIAVPARDADTTGPNQIDAPDNSALSKQTSASDRSPLDLSLEPLTPGMVQSPEEITNIPELQLPALEPNDKEEVFDNADDINQAIQFSLDTSGQYESAVQFSPDTSGQFEAIDNTTEINLADLSHTQVMDPDETYHSLDLDMTINSALNEKTLQGEPFKNDEFSRGYDETLPGVSAEQLAKVIGSQDQPTPVAAQTIFTATNSIAKPSSASKWLLISLAVLAVGSAIIFYYFSVTPLSRDMPSPMVARGVETIMNNSGVNNIASLATDSESLLIQTESVEPGVNDNIVPKGDQDTETLVENAGEEFLADLGSMNDPNGLDPAENNDSQLSMTVDDFGSLPEVIEPPSSLVKITRTPPQTSINPLLINAFTAYQTGDYSLAESMYKQAYENLPNNRDVLLGLAAVATRNGEIEFALKLYLQLLRQNPMDNIARAAVLGYSYGNDTLDSISTIKTMLYDAPDQPLLYFTLGKLHASKTDWSAAQQAFFDAYRLDTSSADFALNLAISLDRLGQSQAALDYYNVAIELAKNSPANFDTASIVDRIHTLSVGN